MCAPSRSDTFVLFLSFFLALPLPLSTHTKNRTLADVEASQLFRRDRYLVGNLRHLAERHRRHRVGGNYVANFHHPHHPVPVRHPRAGTVRGRKVPRVSLQFNGMLFFLALLRIEKKV